MESIRKVSSPLVIVGAGGKLGPTLALMARRAADAAGFALEVIAVSRFNATAPGRACAMVNPSLSYTSNSSGSVSNAPGCMAPARDWEMCIRDSPRIEPKRKPAQRSQPAETDRDIIDFEKGHWEEIVNYEL